MSEEDLVFFEPSGSDIGATLGVFGDVAENCSGLGRNIGVASSRQWCCASFIGFWLFWVILFLSGFLFALGHSGSLSL